MSLPTLSDLKAHLNSTTTTDDGELSDMLDAAVDVVEGIIGPVTARTVTETHRDVRGDVLVLRRMPVAGLVSIGSRSGGSVSPLPVEDFELDADAGLLRRADGYGFAGSYTVSYSSGRPMVPPAVKLAVLIVAAHLWETQRGNTPAGPVAAEVDAGFAAPTAGYAIPNRAKDLLAPFTRSALIA